VTDINDLVGEVDLGHGRPGRPPQTPPIVEIVRPLTLDDLPLLLVPPPMLVPAKTISEISYSHHQLAQLVTQGMTDVQASAISGYSPGWISRLRTSDPGFGELLAYYGKQREQIFVDVSERARVLGINVLEVIQQRLAEKPDNFTIQELRSLYDTLVNKPAGAVASRNHGQQAAGVNLNIKFVSSAGAAGSVDIDNETVDNEPAIDVESSDVS
jgi:hypothetical protein